MEMTIEVDVITDFGETIRLSCFAHTTLKTVKEDIARKALCDFSSLLLVVDDEPLLDDSLSLERYVSGSSWLSLRAFTGREKVNSRKRFDDVLARIKENDTDMVDVDVRGLDLNGKDAKELAEVLRNNQRIGGLFCDVNVFGDEGAEAIAQLLTGNKYIHTLSLSSNRISDIGCIALAVALQNSALVSLTLEDNPITGKGAKYLADAITRENSALSYVVVDRDAMCPELAALIKNFLVVKNDEKLGENLMAAISRNDIDYLRSEKNQFALRMGLFGNFRHGLIHHAVSEGNAKIVQVLLSEMDIDVDFRSGFGRTALHEAAQAGQETVAELLIMRGADLDALDQDGFTPLALACKDCEHGQFKVAQLLAARGAALDIPNRNNCTALDILGRHSTEAKMLCRISMEMRNFSHDLKREKEKWWRTRKFSIGSVVAMTPGLERALSGKLDVLSTHPLPDDEPHRDLVLALAYLSRAKLFEPYDVEQALEKYEKEHTVVSPLLLLAHSRLKSGSSDENSLLSRTMLLREFQSSCSLSTNILNDEERGLLKLTSLPNRSVLEKSGPSASEKLHEEWAQLSSTLTAKQREPMDKLMKMVGLQAVKQIALNLFKAMRRDRELEAQGKKDAIVPKVLNFAFVGNPGTGKTVTAELFTDLLEQSGARSGHRFVQMTASQALQKGAKVFSAELESLTGGKKGIGPPPRPLRRNMNVEVECGIEKKLYPGVVNSIDKTKKPQLYEIMYADGTIEEEVAESRIFALGEKTKVGGVLFLDEAYDLDPANNREGKMILADIMQAAEEHRDSISIILAGYQDDIEKKLYSFNSGMASRFQMVPFEDFTELELREIWTDLCQKYQWEVERKASSVAVARIARGRNLKGFGNARSVRKMFLRIASEATKPGQIMVEDVVGTRPNRKTSAALDAALAELDDLIGQSKVKESILKLVKQAEVNYDRELKGLKVADVGLNRLFLGNPGTGKTTIASTYGKVLKALKLLSNGEVLSKTASDFVGDVVGASQSRTKALIEAAQGKVLLIDEAYALDDSFYGKQALDTIVEKVQGTPGEDIAVVMIGYKPQILKMLRDQNAGLSRRFQPANAFEFEDFTDEQLLETFVSYCRKDGVYAPPPVKALAVKLLRQQRTLPNFGNAGAVKNLLAQAKQDASNRLGSEGSAERIILEIKDLEPNSKGITEQEEALNVLRGFGMIEEQMRQVGEMIQVRNQEGRPLDGIVSNFVFHGAPGTGKTTVARQIAKLLHMYGVLATDRVTETSGAALTGSFVGKAKEIVRDKLEAARGGVMFIDEAYQMGEGSYGREAVAQLVEVLTTEHFVGGKTVVILAGYKDAIDQMMLSNEGLKSRFEMWVEFENWTAERCADYVLEQVRNSDFFLDQAHGARKILIAAFFVLISRPGWGNGRDANTMVKKVLRHRDIRVARDQSAKSSVKYSLKDSDFEGAAREFLNARSDVRPASRQMQEALDHQTAHPSSVGLKLEQGVKQAPKGKGDEEEDSDDAGDPLQKAEGDEWEPDRDNWGGMDPQDISNINNVLTRALKWNKEEIDRFASEGDGGGLLNVLVAALRKNGFDESYAKRVSKQYRHALNEERKKQHQWIIKKKKLMQRPIIQCVVCGSASCNYMPRIIRWETFEVWQDEFNPYKELE